MSWIIVRQFPNWWRGSKESVRANIAADSHSQALTILDDLITKRQNYIDNLPSQTERDSLAESQAELEHAKRHITQGIMLTTNPDSIAQQKERVFRILDSRGDI